MRALYQSSRRILAAASSRHQPLISETFLRATINKRVKPVGRVNLDVAIVQTKRKFVDVPPCVPCGNVMKRAVYTALQNGPHALDSVDRHAAACVLSRTVIDRLMAEEKAVHVAIRGSFVGVQRGAGFNESVDGGLKRAAFGVWDRHGNRPAATLAQTKDRSFTDRSASEFQLLPFVLVSLFAADVGLIYFDHAGKGRLIEKVFSAGFTDSVHHEPRGLLRDAKLFRNLQAGHALACGHHEIHRVQPLVERNFRPLENSSSADGEYFVRPRLRPASVAVVVPDALERNNALARVADGADWAVRPKTRFEIDSRCFRVRPHLENLEGGYSAFAHLELHPVRNLKNFDGRIVVKNDRFFVDLFPRKNCRTEIQPVLNEGRIASGSGRESGIGLRVVKVVFRVDELLFAFSVHDLHKTVALSVVLYSRSASISG